MTIDFKQPKYILPLLAMPFLALFFYVYQTSSKPGTGKVGQTTGMNTTVGEVSDDVRKKNLTDKLDAYRNTYKEADGYTAVSPVPVDAAAIPEQSNTYDSHQKHLLDSIKAAMRQKFPQQDIQQTDNNSAMVAALNHVRKPPPEPAEPPSKEKDPLDLFRQQMTLMDSMQKARDSPVMPAPKKTTEAEQPALSVRLAARADSGFNTLRPAAEHQLIQAIIDEGITGYAGSRLRLRLLADIDVGGTLIKKDSYLFALINGFSGQRVTLEIRTILYCGKILPVKLYVYDTDGLPGLYIPASAFRDFTKDLGTNTIQGVPMDGSSSFVMSSISKVFESTSSAIAGMIRKNKAKLKYNSYIYLINKEQ